MRHIMPDFKIRTCSDNFSTASLQIMVRFTILYISHNDILSTVTIKDHHKTDTNDNRMLLILKTKIIFTKK